MESMRDDTAKPPKMLIEARKTARKFQKSDPRAVMAPMIIMPETALDILINGEYKTGVTPRTTKYPMKEDRTKITSRILKSIISFFSNIGGTYNLILKIKIKILGRKVIDKAKKIVDVVGKKRACGIGNF